MAKVKQFVARVRQSIIYRVIFSKTFKVIGRLTLGLLSLTKLGDGIKAVASRIQNSAIYKILMSKALERVVSLTLGGLAIAGISVVALPAAIVGLVTVAIGSLVDTFSLRTTRRLVKEQKLLIKNRNALAEQNFILMQSPKLSKALEGALFKADRTNQKSITERYVPEASKAKTNIYDYGKAILKNITNALFAIGKAVSAGNIISTIIAIGKAGRSIYSEGSVNSAISAKRNEFYSSIDRERAKEDTPGYNNLRELRISVREQRIQALAIQKMSKEASYLNMSDDEIRKEFIKAKQEIEAREEKIGNKRHPIVKAFRSFGKNFVRAHNPFSKYNDMGKLKVADQGEVAKIMEDSMAVRLLSNIEEEARLQKDLKTSVEKPEKPNLATQLADIKQNVTTSTNKTTDSKAINSNRKSTSSTNLGKLIN